MKFIAILLVLSFVAGTVYAQNPPPRKSDKKVIATVLGKQITARDKDRLNGLIFGTLLEKFARDNKIDASEKEIDTFIQKTEDKGRQNRIKFESDKMKLQMELRTAKLSDRERKNKESQLKQIEKILKMTDEMEERTKGMEEQLRPIKRRNAGNFVKAWKIKKALFAKYGGRIIFQQAGPEPLDAFRDFLREQEKNGAFQILDQQYEAPFWYYFTNEAKHNFYPEKEGKKFINTPWWLMEQPAE